MPAFLAKAITGECGRCVCTVFTNQQTKPPMRNPPKRTVGANIRTQFSQAKCVGAAPVCPPKRPRSDVPIPKIHALRTGNERRMRPCGATRAGTQAPPLPISTKPRGVLLPHPLYIRQFTPTTRCTHPPPYCTFDSSKPCGVPLPHRGCTFDSAGLASATQPTLGNNVSEEATPLGVVLFLITHHYHMRRMDYSRMISPYEN